MAAGRSRPTGPSIRAVVAGLAVAVGSALGTSLAFLFKQRGATLAPPVRARYPLRSAVGLFRSRWFSLGWGLHSLRGRFTSVRLPWPRFRPSRACCRAGWCFSPCSPTAPSAFESDADNGLVRSSPGSASR